MRKDARPLRIACYEPSELLRLTDRLPHFLTVLLAELGAWRREVETLWPGHRGQELHLEPHSPLDEAVGGLLDGNLFPGGVVRKELGGRVTQTVEHDGVHSAPRERRKREARSGIQSSSGPVRCVREVWRRFANCHAPTGSAGVIVGSDTVLLMQMRRNSFAEVAENSTDPRPDRIDLLRRELLGPPLDGPGHRPLLPVHLL